MAVKKTRQRTAKELESRLASIENRLQSFSDFIRAQMDLNKLNRMMVSRMANPLITIDVTAPPGPGREDGLRPQPLDYYRAKVELKTGTRVGYRPGKCASILWNGRTIPTPAGAPVMAQHGPLVYVLTDHPGNTTTPKGWTTRGCYPWNLVRMCEAEKCDGHGTCECKLP